MMNFKKVLLLVCAFYSSVTIFADDETSLTNLEKRLKNFENFCGRNVKYQEALNLCLLLGSNELVRELLEEKSAELNLDERSDVGSSLLTTAMWSEDDCVNQQMVQLLLDKGMSADSQEPEGLGGTILHYAVMQARLGAIKALVQGGAYVNGSNSAGVTPLQWAFYNWSRIETGEKRVDVVHSLLSLGAFVGTSHDYYTMGLLTHCGVLKKRFAEDKRYVIKEDISTFKGYLGNESDLKLLKKMEHVVQCVMIENTLQEECPFSGFMR